MITDFKSSPSEMPAGLSHTTISNQLHISVRQVQYTCQTQRATPKKPKGQPPKLSEEQMDDIIAWISASKQNRRKPLHKVIEELNLGVTVPTLRRSLKKRGYSRCKALRKPPLSQETRRVHHVWALEHINWTVDQWRNILSLDWWDLGDFRIPYRNLVDVPAGCAANMCSSKGRKVAHFHQPVKVLRL